MKTIYFTANYVIQLFFTCLFGIQVKEFYLKPKKKGYAKHTATFLKIEDAIFWEQHVKETLKAVDTQITVH